MTPDHTCWHDFREIGGPEGGAVCFNCGLQDGHGMYDNPNFLEGGRPPGGGYCGDVRANASIEAMSKMLERNKTLFT